jgi:non-ribosomal peptide synthase protein (TIGR01720 family)
VSNPSGSNTQADAETVTCELSEDETRALLTEVPAAYRTQIQEVLLAALARALGGWAGGEKVSVALEGHGREELFEGVDISRTVGWFTSVFPVALDTGPGLDVVETLKTVKEQLRAVPRKGVGYGVLRYLNEETAALLGAHECELSFNYLGQFDQVVGGSASLFEAATEGAGPSQSPRQHRPHELEVGGMVAGGRLRLSWTFSRERLSREEVERTAGRYTEELRGIIERCRAEQSAAFTPSDFPEADLAQKDLDKLLAKFNMTGGESR